jgi:hypothetical protein
MIRKRAVYDPLEPTTEPRWYEVRDMHNRLLESRPLAPGSNLKRAFVVAILNTSTPAGSSCGNAP